MLFFFLFRWSPPLNPLLLRPTVPLFILAEVYFAAGISCSLLDFPNSSDFIPIYILLIKYIHEGNTRFVRGAHTLSVKRYDERIATIYLVPRTCNE